MGIKKICLNCYKEYKNGETQCSYCGFSKDKYERQPSCMDIESELCNGRYLVGQLIDESEHKKNIYGLGHGNEEEDIYTGIFSIAHSKEKFG